MDISLIIYSALGAAIGTLLGRLLSKFLKTKSEIPKAYTAIFTLAGLMLLPFLYRNMYLPRIVPMNALEFGETTILYQAIQKHDPEAYNEIIIPLDQLARKGDMSPESLQETRVVLDKIILQRNKTANVSELRKQAELAIWQFKILKDKAPIVCVQRMNGRPFQNLAPLLPKDYRDQEMKLMASLFEKPARPEHIIADKENGRKLAEEAVKKSVEELGIESFDPPPSDKNAQAKVCDALIYLSEVMFTETDQNVYDISAFSSN